MARILILDGHPDPSPERFIHAAAEAYADGAKEGGHEVRLIRIADLDFPLIRSQAQWQDQAPPPCIVEAQEAIGWARHIVLLYPLWLGDVPALVKGFLEQVVRPGTAFRYRKNALPEKLLAGRSARIVVSMGMPSLFYRLFYLAHSLKSLKRNVFGFIGISPVRQTIVGSVESGIDDRRRNLAELSKLGRQGR